MKFAVLLWCFLFSCNFAIGKNENVTDKLWLSYTRITNKDLLKFGEFADGIKLAGSKFDGVIKKEFDVFFEQAFHVTPCYDTKKTKILMIYGGGPSLGDEGYQIKYTGNNIVIQALGDAGFLYATFHLIRLFRMGDFQCGDVITEVPAFKLRQLNHWDDLNGNIERGYAGKSLWKWSELPDIISSRYEEYARINASIGINSVVLNNVNADPRVIRTDYLKKISILADIFRKYNIKVYLSVNFASPLKPSSTPDKMKEWGGIGNLELADPLDSTVVLWWKNKIAEIYDYIPDFGGFLVKANSEGMPGPNDYNRTHAEGANMLAKSIKPYGGIIIWRAFVYQTEGADPDRMKRAYYEFLPLDGMFDDNVIIQIKNGPLDFQPSEPPSPLFGALKKTAVMAELQVTQEYMGHSNYLVYLLPMWKKFFEFDTFCNGKNSTINKILKGEVWPQKLTAIAGVANTGDQLNWTGHYFAQANWYAYGRLAWNPECSVNDVTKEWIVSTWNVDDLTVDVIKGMMMDTWESFMKSSSPYGLGITTNVLIHYHASFDERNGTEWLANSLGVGTDRTETGSNYVSQYNEPNRTIFNKLEYCPEELMLCFHFVKWDYVMPSGQIFYDFFMENLKSGIRQVEKNIVSWKSIKKCIDTYRYEHVLKKLQKEREDAYIFYNEAHDFFVRQRTGIR